jgi:hypothetical protein
MQYTWVEGTTEPNDFQLKDDGANLVGTDFDVDIEFREAGVSATVAWLDQAAGTVRVTDVTGMTVGKTYHFRFTLTDGNGKIGYCPNAFAADAWCVVPA